MLVQSDIIVIPSADSSLLETTHQQQRETAIVFGLAYCFARSIIVKYNNWDTRCALYRSRPTQKKPVKDRKFASIGLDLTKERISLLERARSLIASNGLDSEVVYAFADVNCNLVVKFGDNDFRHFTNKSQLEAMFEVSGDEDEVNVVEENVA